MAEEGFVPDRLRGTNTMIPHPGGGRAWTDPTPSEAQPQIDELNLIRFQIFLDDGGVVNQDAKVPAELYEGWCEV
ncbi:hypothetical protein LINGRAHAP2_LOCUS25256 [Linum grandiflorum]